MKTKDMLEGQIYTRPEWEGQDLAVQVIDDVLYYVYSDKDAMRVGRQSGIHSHTNFHIVGAKKVKTMRTNKDVNFIGGQYKVVKVCYLDSPLSEYNFKVDVDTEVEKDNLLVVESTNGYGLVTVVEVLANNIDNAEEVNKATAWVVSKVDITRQEARKEATRQRAYIIKQLEERKKAVESVNMYALLAEADPEAKKLLADLKKIDLP